jgi:hypothetical protein
MVGTILHRGSILALALFAAIVLGGAAKPAEPATPEAPYPRIAMLWSPADDIKDKWQNVAKHGVAVVGVDEIGLEWTENKYAAMAETLTPDSITEARQNLDRIHKINPATVVLCEVYFFEETDANYPPDSPWWFRDPKGKKQQFWPGDHMMDLSNAEYVHHIARRIEAVARATDGKAGIYLDNLRFEPADKKAWTALLAEVRQTCPDVPIVVNAGWDSDDLEWVCPLVNGIMYEDSVAHAKGKDTEAFYARIAAFEKLCRTPHLSINERFGPMTDEARMRREFLRTLVYTDMYYLYSKSTNGHNHKWFDVWDTRLGRPVDPAVKPAPGQLVRREFTGGVVLWLPESAKEPVSTAIATPMRDVLAGLDLAGSLTLKPGEGAILVPATATPAK